MNPISRNEKGFTLIELMIAVAIIGILATIALPAYIQYIERGYQAQAHAELVNISSEIKTYSVKNPAQDHTDYQNKLKEIVRDYNKDPQIKDKYDYELDLPASENSRRYRLTATPTASSGYKLSVWLDSAGDAYKCDTAAAAKAFEKEKTKGCERV